MLRCFIFVAIFLVFSRAQQQCSEFSGDDKKKCQNGTDSADKYREFAVEGVDNFLDIYEDLLSEFPIDDCNENCPDPTNSTQCVFTCKDDPCKELTPECLETPGEGDSKKRKRAVRPDHFWRCDFPSARCCRTCRRTIPFVTPITKKGGGVVYPVFCPVRGGYQLHDDVACLKQKCKAACKEETAFISILVTNEPPDGWQGHCGFTWLNVWFTSVETTTHCSCPTEDTKIKI